MACLQADTTDAPVLGDHQGFEGHPGGSSEAVMLKAEQMLAVLK